MIRLGLIVAVGIFATAVNAEDNPIDCVNQIISWCEKQDYTGAGNSIISTSDTTENGEYRYVYCITNRYGTNCHSNNEVWYSCSKDHKVTYKNNPLQKDSANGTDDEICYTAKKAGSNQYNSKEAKRQMKETMRKSDEHLRQRMKELDDTLRPMRQPCFPFCDHNPFGPGFPFNG